MNIYYFSGVRLPSRGPLSVHVMKMAQAFSKAGHNVSVFAKSAWNARSSDIFKIYDVDETFNIELSTHTYFPLLLQARRLRLLKSKNNNTAENPDLIYGYDVLALAYHASTAHNIIFEVSRLPDIPTHKVAFLKLLQNDNLKGIVAHSDTLKHDLLQHYPELSEKNVFVAHDGADLIRFIQDSTEETGVLKGKYRFNVGYAGSLTPGKGLDLIARIAKIRPDYGFHIIGGEKLRALSLEQKNKCKNVYFYGHQDHADIPTFLKSFDVCVAPYQHKALVKTAQNTSRWISPMKIFEYMAAKRPMICSDLPGINNILRHEHDALLLPPFDEERWAQALDKLHDNPDYAEMLSDNAFNSLSENYTWNKRMHAIMKFCGLETLHENTLSARK